ARNGWRPRRVARAQPYVGLRCHSAGRQLRRAVREECRHAVTAEAGTSHQRSVVQRRPDARATIQVTISRRTKTRVTFDLVPLSYWVTTSISVTSPLSSENSRR